jgi:hypothetical protein
MTNPKPKHNEETPQHNEEAPTEEILSDAHEHQLAMMTDFLRLAGLQQVENKHNVVMLETRINVLSALLAEAEHELNKLTAVAETNRLLAKEQAEAFIAGGGDKSLLPRALNTRNSTQWKYDEVVMVDYLIEIGGTEYLTVKKAPIKKALKDGLLPQPYPAVQETTTTITADKDLTWMVYNNG